MIKIKLKKFTWIGIGFGLLLLPLTFLFMWLDLYFLSNVIMFLPNLFGDWLFGEGINPGALNASLFFDLVIYPSFFGLIGLVVDTIINKKKKK